MSQMEEFEKKRCQTLSHRVQFALRSVKGVREDLWLLTNEKKLLDEAIDALQALQDNWKYMTATIRNDLKENIK